MAQSEDIYKTLTAAQERFAYFFLTADAASIAYTLRAVDGQHLAWWMLGIALAVVAWGASFFQGSHYLLHRTVILLLNWQRQRIIEGVDSRSAGKSEAEIQSALESLDKMHQARVQPSRSAGELLFALFYTGAVLYVAGLVWRVIVTR